MDTNARAHGLCDFIEKHGGTIKLNNRAFGEFCQLVLDIWEEGYEQCATKWEEDPLEAPTSTKGALEQDGVEVGLSPVIAAREAVEAMTHAHFTCLWMDACKRHHTSNWKNVGE